MSDRQFPPGTVPAATVTLILIGLLLAAGALGVSALLRGCDRPVQMIPSPMPAAQSSAIATSSAQVTATQSVRVTIRRATERMGDPPETQSWPRGAFSEDLDFCKHPNSGKQGAMQVIGLSASSKDPSAWGPEEIVIEVSQAIAATSSAQASASVAPAPPADLGRSCTNESHLQHGRLGVVAITAPGILAASWQLASVEVPAWAVGVPLEVGIDAEGNLEHIGAGASVGGKAFVLVGGWSRWNLSAQGLTIGAGLRF